MTLIYKATPGWDADARTVGSFSNDGIFTFKVSNSIGVVCGLNSDNLNANYLEIDHAFFIDPRNYKIVERGTVVKGESPIVPGATYGIERLGEVVRYFIDDDLVYTSTLPSVGTVFGDCSLYAYLDTITEACILDYDDGIPGTESEIPPALITQIQRVKDLLQTEPQTQSIIDEINSIWDGIVVYADALETQNPTSTFFEFLNDLVAQVDYLLSLGQSESPAVLALVNAILDLISLGDEALLDDLAVGVAPVGPVGAIGIDEPVNVGYAGIGPVSASGTEADINRGIIDIGPAGAAGAEGDPNWGTATLGSLSVSGQESVLLPDYNAGDVYLFPVAAYGYEGVIDACSGTAAIGPLDAAGSEGDVVFGDAGIGPLSAGGYSAARQYLMAEWPAWLLDNRQLLFNAIVELTVPAPILTAEGNDYDNIRLDVKVPAPILTAFTGAVAPLSVPAPVLTSTGTVQAIARAELEVPEPELTAVASTQTGATVELEVPAPTLTASTGAYASLEVLAPILTATGSVGHLAWVDLTLPFIELTATAKVGTLATVELEIPAPTLETTGIVGAVAHVALVLPAIILTATGRVSTGVGVAASALATETTYAVNLTTGAVTTLLLGELTKLVTAHGRLYGLRSGELVRLDGNLDGSATIPAIVRFAPQTFGSNRAKRLSTVYLNSREDDGLTLDVVADENVAWRYQTATDTARAYGTHKVKVGRGVKFHTAGLVIQNRNGGRMDIGGMELLVDTGAPRPKS